MNTKTIIALGVLFLGLLSLFMFGKPSKDPEGSKDRVLDFEADDVQALTIDRAIGSRPGESPSPSASASGKASPGESPSSGPRKRETLEFEKQDGRWILKQPPYRVGGADMNNILTTLVDMRQNETIDKPNDAAYGFDDPDAIITLKTKDGTHKVTLGCTTLTDQGYYLKVDNQPKVIVSGLGLAALIAKNADAWRDKVLLSVDTSMATRWSVVRDNQTMTLEKNKDDGHWQITQPFSARADDQSASGLLFQMKNVKAVTYHPEIKPDDPRLKPTITLSVWGTDEKTPDTVIVGSQDPKTKNWYAMRSPQQEVFEIEDKSVAPLRKNVDDLQDKHVASYDLPDLTDVVLTVGSTEVDAKKDGFDWTVTKPANTKDDLHKMSSVVEQTHDLTWTRKLTGKDASGDLGFAPPAATVLLHKDKTTIATIQFGKSFGKGQVYVRTAEHPDVVYQCSDMALSIVRGAVITLTAPAATPSPAASSSASPGVSKAASGSPAAAVPSSSPH